MYFPWLTGKYYNYDKELWDLIAKCKRVPHKRDVYMARAEILRQKLKVGMAEWGYAYPD